MALDHAAAREHIDAGFRRIFGRAPTLPEAQCVQAVALIESGYGTAWKGAGAGQNNWGAVQYRTPAQLGMKEPPYPLYSPDGKGFLYTDTTPQADGTSRSYAVYFRRYDTPAEGAADVVRIAYERRPSVLEAASRGDLYGVSAALHATRYYEGFGRTVQDRINNHHKAMMRAVTSIARALGEPLPDGKLPPPPTIRRGDSGESVRAWQRLLGLVADGAFGPATEEATKAFQRANGLDPDGIVGPATWAAADDESPPSTVPEPGTDGTERVTLTIRGRTLAEVRETLAALHEAAQGAT